MTQETLDQALIRPHTPRVWIHRRCGGWVLFELDGGHCLACGALVPVGDYHKPGTP